MNHYATFDRITKDFVAIVDGEIVGYASTFQAAEDLASQVAHERITSAVVMVRTAEILDAVVALKDKVESTLTVAQANAFNKAYNYILECDTVLYNQVNGTVIVESATDDGMYTAGTTCQCKAFESGKLCWHRILARIVKRAMEVC